MIPAVCVIPPLLARLTPLLLSSRTLVEPVTLAFRSMLTDEDRTTAVPDTGAVTFRALLLWKANPPDVVNPARVAMKLSPGAASEAGLPSQCRDGEVTDLGDGPGAE